MIEYKAGRKMVIGICDDDKKWRESCKRTLIGFSTMIDMGCGHQIMVPRKLVEKNTRQITKKA